jgi:diaminopimelate decarboxylase
MTGPVTGFHRRNGDLTCDGVGLREIAHTAGTPVHVYSAATIRERYRRLDAAFAPCAHRLHYALKANSTLAVVRLLRTLGAAADANSGGEIEVALRAGFPAHEIVFTGVGKTRAELQHAVALGVAAINAESPGEIERINALAREAGRRARIAIRVNPDIDAASHPYISTGLPENKFGMSPDDARALSNNLDRWPHVQLVGLHIHIGSQLTTSEPVVRVARLAVSLARELTSRGVALEHIDLGGGLGIPYEAGQAELSVEHYADALLPAARETGLRLLLEPGRWLVGPAGVLIAQVVDLKPRQGGGQFVIVDAGMTDLIRPALYGAWHEIEEVSPRAGRTSACAVVGPVCETSDTLGTDRVLGPLEVGDLLGVRDTGAYGAVMASNYNRRPTAAEVLVDGDVWTTVRRRQTIDDMLQWDE